MPDRFNNLLEARRAAIALAYRAQLPAYLRKSKGFWLVTVFPEAIDGRCEQIQFLAETYYHLKLTTQQAQRVLNSIWPYTDMTYKEHQSLYTELMEQSDSEVHIGKKSKICREIDMGLLDNIEWDYILAVKNHIEILFIDHS